MSTPYSVDQLLRALGREAYEIDDYIGVERSDARPERSCFLLGDAIDLQSPHRIPCLMRNVRLACATTGDDYVVARVNQSRHEERADVAGAAEDENSHRDNVST